MPMTQEEDREFTEFLLTKAREAERALRYRPKLFLQMLASSGGYATAVQLLGSPDISDGFKTLWEKGRLDLTVEALVLESHWRPHFDPILQRAAAKRLQRANYQPVVWEPEPTPPPTPTPTPTPAPAASVAVSPALSVSVLIEWEDTIETVPLQLDALASGTSVQTCDTWKNKTDGTEITTYEAECIAFQKQANGWHIELAYDKEHGKNKQAARAYPELDWGTVTLHVREDLRSATAAFTAQDGSSRADGRCTVLSTPLYANLTRAQVSVLLRPGQAALRNALIERFGRCAVSNETAKDALEAAHIVEHSAGGSAEERNALLLRADIHSLFDAGKLRIAPDGSISLVGVPKDSRYHAELAAGWNKKLEDSHLLQVKAALAERQESGRRKKRA